MATFARFSVMHGTPTGPQSETSDRLLRDLHSSYDMRQHTRTDSGHATVLTDDFIDRYGVVGEPSRVAERLLAIGELGIDKVIAVGATAGGDPEAARAAQRVLADEVLPALRA